MKVNQADDGKLLYGDRMFQFLHKKNLRTLC